MIRLAAAARRFVDWATVGVVVAAYAAFFWVNRGVWLVPPGSDIRPMGAAQATFVLGIAAPVTVIVVSNLSPETESRNARWATVRDKALAASLGLFGLSFVYLPAVAWLRGLRMSG